LKTQRYGKAEKERSELYPSPKEWVLEALKRSPVKEAKLSHAIAIKSRLNEKNQKPVEYPGLLSYIIAMMHTRFFLILFNAVETGRTP